MGFNYSLRLIRIVANWSLLKFNWSLTAWSICLQFNAQVQPPQRTGTEGTANEGNTPSQAGNQSQPGQPFSGQSLPQVVQIPLGAAIAIPSLNMVYCTEIYGSSF